MSNAEQWHMLHAGFLHEGQVLMARLDECLNHLALIQDDNDAVDCLLDSLRQLAGHAQNAGVTPVAQFTRQLRYLIHFAQAAGRLKATVLPLVRRCFALLAWQIELVDPVTGQLPLDDSEQLLLLEQLSHCAGIELMPTSPPQASESANQHPSF